MAPTACGVNSRTRCDLSGNEGVPRFAAVWPDSMELFLREVSATEEDQYCQPCCHSLGSFDRFSGGALAPAQFAPTGSPRETLLVQIGPQPSRVLRDIRALSALRSPRCAPPSPRWLGSFPLSWANAYAHDAQYAALAHRTADLNPRPPMRIRRDANCCAQSLLGCRPWNFGKGGSSLWPRSARHGLVRSAQTLSAAGC